VLPNPFKDELVLKLSGYNPSVNVVIGIYDITGRFLSSYEVPARDIIYLDMSKFASGSYVIEIKYLTNMKRFKVIKE